MYYLNSRYYNPEWGRFINGDALVSTGQGLLSHNMFANFQNNPINFSDPSGFFKEPAFREEDYSPDYKVVDSKGYNPGPLSYPPSGASSFSSSSVPSGGKSVYTGSARICTDGSSGPKGNGKKILDTNWQARTAYSHNGKPIDTYTVPYVVLPAYPKNNTGHKLGDSALLINHDTGKSVMCVIGEVGPEKN